MPALPSVSMQVAIGIKLGSFPKPILRTLTFVHTGIDQGAAPGLEQDAAGLEPVYISLIAICGFVIALGASGFVCLGIILLRKRKRKNSR